MPYTRESSVGHVLDDPAARAVVQKFLPGVANSPMALQLRSAPLGVIVDHDRVLAGDPQRLQDFWDRISEIEVGEVAPRPEAPRIEPDPGYETPDVPRGSARVHVPARGTRYGVVEISFHGPDHGNPFVDVDLTADVHGPSGDVRVGGFYDGEGRYLLRFCPQVEGTWTFRTRSTARSLDGIEGTVEVDPPAPGQHGPVRVADTFHFAHADGTRYTPVGTTAYAWIHQPAHLREQTLETLEASPFTKMRMTVFPKSYLYNSNEPEVFPFVRGDDGEFDHTRFDPAFFHLLEESVAALAERGIEADLILFHAYDRWGFSDMGAAADDRFVQHVVRRLAAFPTVWWSMANEYDLLWAKTVEDWERMAQVVVAEDHVGHLNSIHNCFGFYDYTRPWITHCSTQRIDVYRTAENTTEWREQWGKPIVVDECAYEGDIDQGWGNITGEEMTRRCWEGAVRGGYVAHGETYWNEREEIWWSKGGELVGDSPARMGFLADVIGQAPGGAIEPLASEWDVRWGGVDGEYLLAYLGFGRPRFRDVVAPPGRWTVDVIDTWNMTVDRLEGEFEGRFRVQLPARQWMALRLVRVRESS
ncbi:DUF5605 domain-containing protein [Kineococcus rhizosphaerae]|uniref:Uncharacterized protein DUF5060 n=1 Tax=Kineococcus rhizosphaerae TaxID=559628 RepID=A0A2T0R1W6_9ACTN|nr:DUF5605 domain-containing protein [Kineococcus rhizosphaerae]PRY13557.1 uncharacterized protein DUF5060 [Kineococcus rhizosphaerae]